MSNSALDAVTITTNFRMVFSLTFLIEENVNLVALSCYYYSKRPAVSDFKCRFGVLASRPAKPGQTPTSATRRKRTCAAASRKQFRQLGNIGRDPPGHHIFAAVSARQYCGRRGTVVVPMLVRILKTYDLPEITTLATATLCMVVSIAFVFGAF